MLKKYFVLLVLPFLSFSQSDINSCETLSKINKIIQEQHYRPKPLDDSLSVFVFDDFFKELDQQNLIFNLKEVKSFNKHRLQIDNYVKEKNCTFLAEIFKSYNIALTRYKNLIETLRKEPFLYSSTESVIVSSKKFINAVDENDAKRSLKKRILFNVLRDVASVSKNKDSLVANFEKLSKSSKEKIFESYLCKYSLLQITEKDFNAKFFNSFCTYFDPHTMFLTDNDKSSFFSNLSSDNLSFGIGVSQNEKQDLIVDNVVPGSSAYFSQKLNDGDQILSIKYLDNEYKVGCSNMEIIGKIFSSNEYKNADFSLRKKSGEQYNVSLSKKLITDYGNIVYSYIIEKNKKKTGYIRIPSFYATFENGKTNVSDDVTKEIYKLKADKIDGLILDLQGNGGGSMDEAIQLSGSFIDFGIVAIRNSNSNKKQFIKDPNRGSIYDGPMVVLIDGSSASASEFFANAMQDYKRAIIVGTNSFGKASVQRVFPLAEDDKKQTFIKLTIEAFYRISGKTNQTIGVKPDINIPQLFNNQIPREIKFKTALTNNTIEGILMTNEFINPKRNAIINKSLNRASLDENFKKTIALNLKIDKVFEQDSPAILLNFSSVFESVNKINVLWKEIFDFNKIQYELQVYQSTKNREYQEFDEYMKSSNIEKIKAIKRNLHIIEAVNIINESN